MNTKIKWVIYILFLSVLTYVLCLYGWIPQIMEYISYEVDTSTKFTVFALSLGEAVLFAISMFNLFETMIATKKEKWRKIISITFMVVYIAGMVLLKNLYENIYVAL